MSEPVDNSLAVDTNSLSAYIKSMSLISDFILFVRELLVSDGRVLPGEEGAELRGLPGDPVTIERLVGGLVAPVGFPALLRLSEKKTKLVSKLYTQKHSKELICIIPIKSL